MSKATPSRPWVTTREIRAMLGVSQQRVSQLVQSGALIAEADVEGRLRYDRASAERLARERAARAAETEAEADDRRALQAEARERAARERRELDAQRERRAAFLDAQQERGLLALETIARALKVGAR